jgi:hypothetical protein
MPEVAEVDEGFDKIMCKVAEDVATRVPPKETKRLKDMFPVVSVSACVEYTRAQGGHARWLSENRFLKLKRQPPLALSLLDSVLFRNEKKLHMQYLYHYLSISMEKERNLGGYILPSVLFIPTRGAKVRVVTKHHSVDIERENLVRERFLPHILNHRNFCNDARDLDLGPCRKNRKIYSFDFKSATDLLSRRLGNKAYIALVGENAGVSYLEGGEFTSLPDGSTVRTSRGLPMGKPMSWTLFNIIHIAIFKFAKVKRMRYRINGDDSVAYLTEEEAAAFVDISTRLVGLSINDLKTFVADSAAIYCEKEYRKVPDSGNRMIIRPLPFTSLGFLCPLGERQKKEVPPYDGYLAPFPLPTRWNLFRFNFKNLIGIAKKASVDIFIPPALGGLGMQSLLSEDLLDAVVPSKYAVMATYLHNHHQLRPIYDEGNALDEFISNRLANWRKKIRWFTIGNTPLELMALDEYKVIEDYVIRLYTILALQAGLSISRKKQPKELKPGEEKTEKNSASNAEHKIVSVLKRREKILLKKSVNVKPLTWTYSSIYFALKMSRPVLSDVMSFAPGLAIQRLEVERARQLKWAVRSDIDRRTQFG